MSTTSRVLVAVAWVAAGIVRPQVPTRIVPVLTAIPPGAAKDVPADLILESGHSQPVTALAFSPDGATLASASRDATIRLWDTATGMQRSVLRGHAAPVRSIAFTNDGELLASGSDDGAIRIWNIPQAKTVVTLQAQNQPVTALDFDADGRHLLSAGAAIQLWDVAAASLIRDFGKPEPELTQAYFCKDDSAICIASQNGDMEVRGIARIYDAHSGRLLGQTQELIRAVADHGRTLALQQGQWQEQTIQLRKGAEPVGSFSGAIKTIAFSRNGAWIAYAEGTEGKLTVRSVVDERDSHAIVEKPGAAEVLAISPDGQYLATGGRTPEIDLWNVAGKRLAHTLAPQYGVNAIAFTPDSKHLASLSQGDGAGAFRLWGLPGGNQLPGLSTGAAGIGMAFSPTGDLLAIAGRTLAIWSLQDRKQLRELTCSADVVISPVFSPNGARLAGNCRGVITVWDVSTGRVLFQQGSVDYGNSGGVLFSPDGRYLAASTGMGRLTLFDLATGRPEKELTIPGIVSALAFSPDGHALAAGSRVPLRVAAQRAFSIILEPVDSITAQIVAWDLKTGATLFAANAGQWVSTLAFTNDSKTLLAVSGKANEPGSFKAFDSLNGGAEIAVLPEVDASNAAAFSPDRHWLAGSGSGRVNAVKVWRIESTR